MEESGMSVPPQHTIPTNPLLQRIQMPGETFALPSGGLFYTHGELDESVQNAEVHVHPMTALDEITIKTPDLLFSGEAVKQVFSRCIPQVKNVDALFAKDVDFLLVCLRKVSYGDELRVEHQHDCEGAKTHQYSLDVGDFIRTAKKIDPTSVTREFTVKMPNGQKVLLQPIRFKEFIRVMQVNEAESTKEPERIRDMMVNSVSSVIVKVDEIDDVNMIREWLREVPPSFLTAINDNIDSTLEWGPDFNVRRKCKDCGKMMEVLAPMNPLAFFT